MHIEVSNEVASNLMLFGTVITVFSMYFSYRIVNKLIDKFFSYVFLRQFKAVWDKGSPELFSAMHKLIDNSYHLANKTRQNIFVSSILKTFFGVFDLVARVFCTHQRYLYHDNKLRTVTHTIVTPVTKLNPATEETSITDTQKTKKSTKSHRPKETLIGQKVKPTDDVSEIEVHPFTELLGKEVKVYLNHSSLGENNFMNFVNDLVKAAASDPILCDFCVNLLKKVREDLQQKQTPEANLTNQSEYFNNLVNVWIAAQKKELAQEKEAGDDKDVVIENVVEEVNSSKPVEL